MKGTRCDMGKNEDLLASTVREKCIHRISIFVKKHRRMYYPGVVAVAAVIFATAVGGMVYGNRRRILSLLSILLFFVASTSFSFPDRQLDISFFTEDIGLSGKTEYLNAAVKGDNSPEPATTISLDEKSEASGIFSADLLNEFNETGSFDSAEEELINARVDGNGELLGTVAENDQIRLSDIVTSDQSTKEREFQSEAGSSDADSSAETADTLSFTEDDWKLILINKQHPLPEDYTFPMTEVASGGKLCDERILASLKKMFTDAASDGVTLVVCSPYRSNKRQMMLFDRKVDSYIEKGSSYMEAYTLASQAVTLPGSSEHEAGLALDLISDNYCSLDEGFGKTDAGTWLEENSWKYGFVVRYLKGKESITGIEYEPWHFRYVGNSAARVMHDEGICLEEFWNKYIY